MLPGCNRRRSGTCSTQSRPRASSSASAPPWRSTASASRCSRAQCSAFWGPTAPGRRPRSGSWQRCWPLTAGAPASAGHDVATEAAHVRRAVGLTGQYASVDEALTGRQNLVMIGQLLDLSSRAAKSRAAELLAWFDLTDAADRPARTYSGGMRRRLDLAASLVGRPSVVFLDEPTTGLDPSKREDMWAIVRSLVSDGSTVLLTTQYLDEADALADDIIVIDHGRVIAHDRPDGPQADRRPADADAVPGRSRSARRRRAGARRRHRSGARDRARPDRERRRQR